MSGEINATNIIIQNINGDIVGQMEMTLTFVGAPIDITNKSFNEWVEIFEGELGIKQLQISGTIVYNNDDQYRKVRHDAFNGNLDTYIISYISNAAIVEILTATMMPNGLSDALPHGDKLTTSLTFLSSGPVSITPVIALLTDIYPVISIEENPIVGSISVSGIRDLTIAFESPLVAGSIAVDDIVQQTVIINYEETENEVTGIIAINAIDQIVVLIELESTENEITGTIDISSIIQDVVLVSYEETENEVTGTISIESITQI